MKFIPEPSLEHFVLVKIVVALWNRNDIRSLMAKFSFRLPVLNRIEEWQKIEVRIIEKVSQLPLPELLNNKLKNFVKPIGIQILKWIEYHCESHYINISLPTELCWTSQGTIDKKKTAEMLVRNERLDITNRYKLACIYCLDNYIPELWNKMPVNFRESFSYTGFNQGRLFIFWEKEMLKRKFGLNYHLTSSVQSVFEFCAVFGFKAATEYFLPKLTTRERKQTLLKTAENVDDDDVFCYLLSQLDEEQQTQIFTTRPYKVLRYFLNWPFQCLFIEASNHMWDFLPCSAYNDLLLDIIEKTKLDYRDWNYQNLFGKFWQESPGNFKTYIIEKCSHGFLLPELFQIKDKTNLKLIIEDASVTQKKKIIYSYVMLIICENLFLEEDWDLLGFLMQECLQSEYEMMKFKKKFETRNNIKYNIARNKQKWNQLFPFCDEAVPLYINSKCISERKKSI